MKLRHLLAIGVVAVGLSACGSNGNYNDVAQSPGSKAMSVFDLALNYISNFACTTLPQSVNDQNIIPDNPDTAAPTNIDNINTGPVCG